MVYQQYHGSFGQLYFAMVVVTGDCLRCGMMVVFRVLREVVRVRSVVEISLDKCFQILGRQVASEPVVVQLSSFRVHDADRRLIVVYRVVVSVVFLLGVELVDLEQLVVVRIRVVEQLNVRLTIFNVVAV